MIAKIEEEVAELRETLEREPDNTARAEEEMGDLLFAIANLSRKLGIEPEAALRKANDKFTKRFNQMEENFTRSGGTLEAATLEEMEAEWKRIKARGTDAMNWTTKTRRLNTKTTHEARRHQPRRHEDTKARTTRKIGISDLTTSLNALLERGAAEVHQEADANAGSPSYRPSVGPDERAPGPSRPSVRRRYNPRTIEIQPVNSDRLIAIGHGEHLLAFERDSACTQLHAHCVAVERLHEPGPMSRWMTKPQSTTSATLLRCRCRDLK